MNIIDAHAHVFETLCGFGAQGELRAIGGGMARWADGTEQRVIPEGCGDRSFPAETYLSLMDRYHIERTVLLQGGMLGFANDYLYGVMQKYPDRFLAAGTVDPYCRKADAIIDRLAGMFHVFKFEVSMGGGMMGEHEVFPLDGAMMMGMYERIAKTDHPVVAFDLGSPADPSNQPDAIAHIADAFPGMQVVVCHLGSPRRFHGAQLRHLLETTRRPNVSYDLAALWWKTRPEEYPFPVAREFTLLAKDLVGADHLLWGTDSPSTLCKKPMAEQIGWAQDLFDDRDREAVYYRNALRVYWGGVISRRTVPAPASRFPLANFGTRVF